MKHLNFSIIILSALLLASCTKSEVTSSENMIKASIYASFDQENKSTVDETGKTAWEAGDRIKVYDANLIECGSGWVAETGGEEVKFTGEMGATQVPTYAVYPYEAAVECPEIDKVTIRIPEKQDGSFSNAIAVAKISDIGQTVVFKNSTTVLKLKLSEEDTNVDSLILGTNVNLSGDYKISITSPASQSPIKNFKRVILVPKSGESKIATNEDLYICIKSEPEDQDILPELTISLLKDNGTIDTKTKTLSNKFSINTIKNLGEINPEETITRVSYIKKDGKENTAYINTNITPAVGDDFSSEMEVAFLAEKGFFFGSRPSYTASHGYCLAITNSKIRFDYNSNGGKDTKTYSTPISLELNTKYKITTNKNECNVYKSDGELLTSVIADPDKKIHGLDVKSTQQYHPLAIGVARTQGGAQTGQEYDYIREALPQVKFYSFKLWRNEVLVCDYIPMKDKNGEGGMFDKISGKFLKSVMQDKFTYGED